MASGTRLATTCLLLKLPLLKPLPTQVPIVGRRGIASELVPTPRATIESEPGEEEKLRSISTLRFSTLEAFKRNITVGFLSYLGLSSLTSTGLA